MSLIALFLLFFAVINEAASTCETSSFQNIRAVLSGKSKEDPVDFILTDCMERNEATKNYYTVEIINQNVEQLNRAAFVNLTVTTLILSNNRIDRIEKQAFLNLKSLQNIDLSKNRLTTLIKDVFNDLISLKTLDLSNNRIDRMDDEVFAHMVSLQELRLNDNKLKVWNPNWFANNADMNKLEAERNLLETLPGNSFHSMEKLKSLLLRENRIEEIHADAFKGLNDLSLLDLSINRLRKLHDDTFAPFNGLASSRNRGGSFSIFGGIDVFAGLWDLHLHTNNLTYFSDKMMKDLMNTNNLKSFTFHSNPLQCACYMKIIKWADGARWRLRLNDSGKGCYRRDNPVCVVPQKNSTVCLEEPEEDLRSLYFSKFKVPINNFFDRNVVCSII